VPEGDTIFRTASTLHRALAGATVTRFETQLPALARIDEDYPLKGRTVEFARATGKWIELAFSGDLILLTHMLMSGSWHIYRPGERWQRSRYHMRVVIQTEKILAVAFDVQVAEFHTAQSLSTRKGFSQLGPDVLSPDFNEAEAVNNLLAHPDLELGTALLNQSILAGVGNMFKAEVCFLAAVNPFERVANLSRDQLTQIVEIARDLLKISVTARPPLWVYRRTGERCRKCGDIILSRKQGTEARTSFWCPTCQRMLPC